MAGEKQPELPAQIELLETKVRFEANGDSRKEVHARVRINNELGARQFARLNFDYNRSYQRVELPLVRITHAGGGTAEILSSAISDQPNPAVVKFPAYQDVRVKSVRILGLGPDDQLEYRVVTSTTNDPLAPDFWFEHSFDRSGVVAAEILQVELPASMLAQSPIVFVENEKIKHELERRLIPDPGCGLCGARNNHTVPIAPAPVGLLGSKQVPELESGRVQIFVTSTGAKVSIETSGNPAGAKVSYTWSQNVGGGKQLASERHPGLEDLADVAIGKNSQWPALSYKLFKELELPVALPDEVVALSRRLTNGAETPLAKTQSIYNFVSQKIRTVDLPLGATGFKPRGLAEIITSEYATQEDKFFLFEALAKAANFVTTAALIGPAKQISTLTANPAAFSHLLIDAYGCNCWLDPALEVAPFAAIPASYRGSTALLLGTDTGPITDGPLASMLTQIPKDLPFRASQHADIDAHLSTDGTLRARVQYSMRGDNELLLRLAFHQTPKEKWQEVAQLLALSDGFRGKVTGVTASDPYATAEPFTVEYEITQAKFVDWSKKPVHIPALLPLMALPEAAAKPGGSAESGGIDLGTPLDVQTRVTVRVPPDTSIRAPAGISVERDYATFASEYSARNLTLTAERHINFLHRELAADRAADYAAFVRAVQNDQAQEFTLERGAAPSAVQPADSKPAKSKT